MCDTMLTMTSVPQSPPAAQNTSVSDANQLDQLDDRLIPQREQLMTSILAEEDDLIRAHRDQVSINLLAARSFAGTELRLHS